MWRWVHLNLLLPHELGLWRARSLLRRDSTAELVAWELVQVSLPSLRSLHTVLVAIVNRHVARRVCAPPRNDIMFSQNLPYLLCWHYARCFRVPIMLILVLA